MARDTWTGPRWATQSGTSHHARSVADATLGDRVPADRYTVKREHNIDRLTLRAERMATDGKR